MALSHVPVAYWTVLIPWTPTGRTEWHPDSPTGPFAVLTRGAFPTARAAHAWAAAHLGGAPYRLRRIVY